MFNNLRNHIIKLLFYFIFNNKYLKIANNGKLQNIHMIIYYFLATIVVYLMGVLSLISLFKRNPCNWKEFFSGNKKVCSTKN